MKAITVKQPWASLVCGGVCDVLSLPWGLDEIPGRVLIYANKIEEPTSMIYRGYGYLVSNARLQGRISPDGHEPNGVILGYADVIAIDDKPDLEWFGEVNRDKFMWHVKNAKLFVEPIPYTGSGRMFDVPELSECNLPEAEDFTDIELDGQLLTLPVAPHIFDQIDDIIPINVALTERVRKYFVNDNYNSLSPTYIDFINQITKECKRVLVFELAVGMELDPNNRIVEYLSLNGKPTNQWHWQLTKYEVLD